MKTTLALLVAVLALGFVTTVATPAASQEDVDATFQNLASCFDEREHLIVLALMDESGSLRRTDPGDRRVTALEAALTNLAGLRSIGGESSTLEIAMAGFSADFEMVVHWRELNEQTSRSIQQEAQRFAQRDSGRDTDFALALQGAQSELASRAAAVTAEGEAPPCRVLLMFTDGAYDIEPRSTGEIKPYAPDFPLDVAGNDVKAENAGRAFICNSGGVADSIRSTGTPIITVAFSAEIGASDQGFLEAVSSGRSGAVTCGDLRSAGVGVYIPADDLETLLFAFDRVTGRMLGGQPLPAKSEVPFCQREACAQGRQEFALDRSLRQAHVLADFGAEGVVAQFQGPSGSDPVVVDAKKSKRVEHSGAELAAKPLSATAAVIDVTLPLENDDWIGTWSVTFIDTSGANPDAIARTQIILFGALEPKIVGDPTFRLGEPSKVEVQVVDQAGTSRNPADFVAEAMITASVTDPLTGQPQRADLSGPDGDGRWTISFTPSTDLQSTAVNVSATLTVETNSGVTLQPRTANRSIPILPPATYPTVTPAELRLGTLTGPASLTGTLTVSASQQNGGCVWFGAGPVEKPRYSGNVAATVTPDATSEDRCLEVAAGEAREVEISFSASEVGDGSVRAPLRVHLRSDASPDVLSRTLPVSFEMLRPVDQIKRLGFFLAILLPGLVLPFALMYFLNWRAARFRSPGFTRHARIPARVTADGRLLRQDAGGRWLPFDLLPDDLSSSSGPSGTVRGFSADGLRFHARTPLNPFRESYAVVSANGAQVVSTDGTAAGGERGGRLGFELPNSWAFVTREVRPTEEPSRDEHPFEVIGDLHVWLQESPFAEQGPRIVDRVLSEVPPAVRSVGEMWRDRAADPEVGRRDDEVGYVPPSSGTERTPAWAPLSSQGSGAASWQPPAPSDTGGSQGGASAQISPQPGEGGYTPPPSDASPDLRRLPGDGHDGNESPAWRPPHERGDHSD